MNGLKKYVVVYLLLLFQILTNVGFAQVVVNYSDNDSTADLLKSISTVKWKYHKGDEIAWASPDFNDITWDSAKTKLNLDDLSANYFTNIAWFRLSVNIDSSLINKPIAFSMSHNGASEIYLNGKLIKHFGKVCALDSGEKRIDPQNEPFAIAFTKSKNNLIAVRYSNTRAQEYYDKYDENEVGFHFKIRAINAAISSYASASEITLIISMSIFGFFVALGALHLLIFLFYHKQPANLLYSIFVFLLAMAFLTSAVAQTSPLSDYSIKTKYFFGDSLPILFLSLLAMIYMLFKFNYTTYFKICLALVGLFLLLDSFHFEFLLDARGVIISALITVICFDCGYRVSQAVKQKKDGAWIIASGVMIFLMLIGVFYVIAVLNDGVHISSSGFWSVMLLFMFVLIILSIPLSMSIYLARDFARTNKNLSIQLNQVQILSQQAIEQEQEKQKILNEQNVMLEHQVAERTAELSEKNKEMTDSIRYAQRIQKALMSSKNLLEKNLPEHFVFFNPKDIVSGDFYWASLMHDGRFALATADSTGHGVPGAFMSLLNISYLNEAINERRLISTADILNHARKKIIQSLAEDGTADGGKDGMDCSIAAYDFKTKTMQYSAANNPVWIIRDNAILEFAADKMPVGKHDRDNVPFTAHSIQLQAGDVVYTLTDGFPDQFGGPKGKKFKYKSLQELLLSICNSSMDTQKEKLVSTFTNWKGNLEQVDDVLLIGVRVS
ncbi:MAG TPA: SpoIIE family protein phosphatase [Bacteroidia bacterium]|nr:SpoIIE family protein phosphatase [Bacteroidia bacterium]